MFTAGCCILCLSVQGWVVNKCQTFVFNRIVRRAAMES